MFYESKCLQSQIQSRIVWYKYLYTDISDAPTATILKLKNLEYVIRFLKDQLIFTRTNGVKILKKISSNVALVIISCYSKILIFGDLRQITSLVVVDYVYSIIVTINMIVVTLDAQSHRI